ncbi:MAG: hypothetical protein KA297_19570 [Kofleriaceae bacterium]|jgi:hypothetical protein|nr:hypothetical protein [Kofleriaceae bacterium]MBP6840308.1 hypothetical protein [Kofleriaceae bacterium]
MRRLSLLLALVLAPIPACVDQDAAPGEAFGTVEQHGTNTRPIAPTDYRPGQRLYARTTVNPIAVVTAGDRPGTFFVWGTENGEAVRWIVRASIEQHDELLAQIGTEFLEIGSLGDSVTYGLAGNFKKPVGGGDPGPVGYPPDILKLVADYAGAQLTAAKEFDLALAR